MTHAFRTIALSCLAALGAAAFTTTVNMPTAEAHGRRDRGWHDGHRHYRGGGPVVVQPGYGGYGYTNRYHRRYRRGYYGGGPGYYQRGYVQPGYVQPGYVRPVAPFPPRPGVTLHFGR